MVQKPRRRHEISIPTPLTRETLDIAALHKPQGHKFTHGHALILSGGAGRTGAARLAARAALRVGAGLVTLGMPPAAQMEVAGHITSVMLTRVPDGAALQEVLTDTRLTALCLGPGLGLHDEKHDLIQVVLKSGLPAVLDADALTLISQSDRLFAALHPACIMTPHGGEFSRLFGDLSAKLDGTDLTGRAAVVGQAAQRAGCTVLLKGAQTLIAAPDGACDLHDATGPRAAPWLATAGAGDVLSGILCGLLARGLPMRSAAGLATYLHVEAARTFGPGLIAEDLPEQLPAVFRNLGP